MAFIYLINEYGTNKYKIGLTKDKSIEFRRKRHQTGNSVELYTTKYFETEYPYKLERLLHAKYHKEKVNGEWFELEDSEVLKFNETCIELNNIIKFMKENNEFYK